MVNNMRKWSFRILGTLCVLLSAFLYIMAFSADADTTMTVIATLFLIGGFTLYIMASSKTYHDTLDTIKRVDGV